MNKLSLILFFLLVIVSCKKEEDEEYPTVSFQTPGFQSQFDVLEIIPFKIMASDNKNIERITVHLLNENLQTAATPVSVYPGVTDYTFEYSIITEDIHLSSGIYYLKAVVSDGHQEKVAYREIYLNEVPKRLEQVWIARKINSQQFYLDTLTSISSQNVFSISNDFSGLVCNSYFGRILAIGGKTGDSKMFRLDYLNPFFTITNSGSGAENFFTSFIFDADRIYIARRDGLIHSYSYSSNPQDVFTLGNHFSEAMCITDNYLVSASVNSSGLVRNIQVYYKGSSVLNQSLLSDIESTKIFAVSQNEILLFGNKNSLGEIRLYDISQNQISEPFNFSGGKINDISKINPYNYLIAHSNGISIYNHQTGNQMDITGTIPYSFIKYEELSNTFYAAEGLQVWNMNLTGIINQTFTISDSIAGLDLLYNK